MLLCTHKKSMKCFLTSKKLKQVKASDMATLNICIDLAATAKFWKKNSWYKPVTSSHLLPDISWHQIGEEI